MRKPDWYGKPLSEWPKQRRSEERKRLRGECQRCAEKAIPGQSRCERHRLANIANLKKHIASRKAAGLCQRCGKPLSETDGATIHARGTCRPRNFYGGKL